MSLLRAPLLPVLMIASLFHNLRDALFGRGEPVKRVNQPKPFTRSPARVVATDAAHLLIREVGHRHSRAFWMAEARARIWAWLSMSPRHHFSKGSAALMSSAR